MVLRSHRLVTPDVTIPAIITVVMTLGKMVHQNISITFMHTMQKHSTRVLIVVEVLIVICIIVIIVVDINLTRRQIVI